MDKSIKNTRTLNWLEAKLINGDCGIIFDDLELDLFEIIQNFIENYDRTFQTPVIYYQAFPEETALQFLDTLGEELMAKLGNLQSKKKKSFSDIIQNAGLKMIIIDDCHLHPQDTLEQLLAIFSDCNVAVILVGERQKMAIAQILDRPIIRNWEIFRVSLETVS